MRMNMKRIGTMIQRFLLKIQFIL